MADPIPAGAPAPAANPAPAAAPAAQPHSPEVAAPKTNPPAGEPAAPTAQPQPGELEIKLPEGMQVNEEYMGGLKAVLKQHGLNSKQAQALVDHHFAALKKSQESAAKEWEQTKAGWTQELKNDAQFGGKNFDANLDTANKLMRMAEQKVPGFAKLLADTGLGQHPIMVKALHMLGAAIADDKLDVGEATGGTDNSEEAHLRQMYPNSPGLFAKG